MGAYPSVDCASSPQSSYTFCDTSKSPEERATDLVSRLTTEEIIAQTSTIAPAISRLGINAYNWRSNCLHGWASSGGHWTSGLHWTVFPAPINLGASFDPEIVEQVGSATSTEGRALHNIMLEAEKGDSTEAAGLNCFSPNVNFLRDPRWGRLQESFSEDTFLLSVLGAAYTNGLQIVSTDHIKPCDNIIVTVTLTNTGSMIGEEVVQVYLTPPSSLPDYTPNIQMVGFARVSLKPSDKEILHISVSAYLMSFVDDKGERLIYPGSYTFSVGGALPGKTTAVGDVTIDTVSFDIDGDARQPVAVSSCTNDIPKCLAC
uniref:Fibronectin type III-like domain-containing protein n=2 Tax=Amphimedon queenslandica TaxID=400682 RepID=A0A1X7THL1_AMPQE